MLVLGAIDDRMRTMAEVSATAQVYRTEVEFFPNMGHNMMLERDGGQSPKESTAGSRARGSSQSAITSGQQLGQPVMLPRSSTSGDEAS